MVAIMFVLAHVIGPTFLVIGIPALIIASIFSPNSRDGIRMYVGVFMFIAVSPVSALYVWYQYNFIAAIIVGIVVFMIGQKMAEP